MLRLCGVVCLVLCVRDCVGNEFMSENEDVFSKKYRRIGQFSRYLESFFSAMEPMIFTTKLVKHVTSQDPDEYDSIFSKRYEMKQLVSSRIILLFSVNFSHEFT
jgi:hypothetical protein